jgi:hypothetical protein
VRVRRYNLLALIDEVENLLINEAKHRNRYYEFFVDQEKNWIELFKRWDKLKQGYLLTKAFIRRVYLAYESEFLLKRRIERGSQRSISSDIENIFGQMLRAFLKARNLQNFQVRINKIWSSGPRTLQPDILVLKNGKEKCVVELKTDLGWNRKKWHEALNDRLDNYIEKGIARNCVFVVVLTTANWLGRRKETEMDTALEDELMKWKGERDNFVFLLKDSHIHPNSQKHKHGVKIDSLDALDITSLSSLESVFEKILMALR